MRNGFCVVLAVCLTGSLTSWLSAAVRVDTWGLPKTSLGPIGSVWGGWFDGPLAVHATAVEVSELGNPAPAATAEDALPEPIAAAQLASALAELQQVNTNGLPLGLYRLVAAEGRSIDRPASSAPATKVQKVKSGERAAPEPAGAVLAFFAGLAVLWFAIGERRKRSQLALGDE